MFGSVDDFFTSFLKLALGHIKKICFLSMCALRSLTQ